MGRPRRRLASNTYLPWRPLVDVLAGTRPLVRDLPDDLKASLTHSGQHYGYTTSDMLAEELGVTARTIERHFAAGEITMERAEQYCDRIGRHPADVWLDTYCALVETLDVDDAKILQAGYEKAWRDRQRGLVAA